MRPVITDINFIKAVYELVYRLEHSQGMFPANADSAIRALWNNLIKDGGGKRKKQLLVQYFRTSCAWCLWEDSIQVSGNSISWSPRNILRYSVLARSRVETL